MLWENNSQVGEPYEKNQPQIIKKEADLSLRWINARAEIHCAHRASCVVSIFSSPQCYSHQDERHTKVSPHISRNLTVSHLPPPWLIINFIQLLSIFKKAGTVLTETGCSGFWVSLQQLICTQAVIPSLNLFLLHHYFKDYAPLPLSCLLWNTFHPKRSSFLTTAPASSFFCCSVPKLPL